MKLFNKTIDNQLFEQYALGSDLSKQEVVVKIFNPSSNGSWFILNSDPNDPDYLWAIVDLGYGAEVGSVSRSDLETYRGKFGLGFERDLSFDPINAEELYKGLRQGKSYADGGGVDDYSDLYGQEVMTLKNAKNQAKKTGYDYLVYLDKDGEFSFARKNEFERFFDKDDCKILYSIDEKGNATKMKSYADGGNLRQSLEEVLKQDVTFLKFDSGRAYEKFSRLEIPFINVHDYDFNHYCIIENKNLEKVLDNVSKGVRVVKKKFLTDDLGFDYKGSTSFADGGYFDGTIPNTSSYMTSFAEGGSFNEWEKGSSVSFSTKKQASERLSLMKNGNESKTDFRNLRVEKTTNGYAVKFDFKDKMENGGFMNGVYSKGGEIAKAEVFGFSKNIMGTTDIEMKISGMRKAQDFIVYPIGKDDAGNVITIQSNTRIGQINLVKGFGVMSQSHLSGAYFVHLQMDKLTSFTISESDLEKIKAHIFKTAGVSIGNKFIVSDNLGASGVYAKGGRVDVEKVNKADEIYREHNRERKEKGIENFSKESVALWNEKYNDRLEKLKLTFEEKNALNPKKWYAYGGSVKRTRRTKDQIRKAEYNKDVDLYNWYVVNLSELKAESGFEHKEDALDLLSDYDGDKNFKVVSKRALKTLGIEIPNESWKYDNGGSFDDDFDGIAYAKTNAKSNIDWDKELREYAGEKEYLKLTRREKEEMISDLKRDWDRSNSYAEGGQISKSEYEKLLQEYNKLGALLEDSEHKQTRSFLSKKMDDLEIQIHKYERGYAKGGSLEVETVKIGDWLQNKENKAKAKVFNIEKDRFSTDIFVQDFYGSKVSRPIDLSNWKKITEPTRELARIEKIKQEFDEEMTYAKDGSLEVNKLKYINHSDIKAVTLNRNGKQIIYKGDDVFNGANVLEEGGDLTAKANYVPKRDVVGVELKDGTTVKPVNGYWIKKDAIPIGAEPTPTPSSKSLSDKEKEIDDKIAFFTANDKEFNSLQNKSNEQSGYFQKLEKERVKLINKGIFNTEEIDAKMKEAKEKANLYFDKSMDLLKKYQNELTHSNNSSSSKSEPKISTTEIRKDPRGNWRAETTIDDFNDYDWRLTTVKTYSGQLISSAQGGKFQDSGTKGINMFKCTMYEDPYHTLEASKPTRLTEKVVSEQHEKALAKFKKFMETGMFKGGGQVSSFDKLSAKVAKEYEGKPVKSKYQEEYGHYYSKEEAQEVGDKVAGKMKAMQTDSKSFVGKVKDRKNNSGAETLKKANDLAKEIRKDGESWLDAKKRAFAQLKK